MNKIRISKHNFSIHRGRGSYYSYRSEEVLTDEGAYVNFKNRLDTISCHFGYKTETKEFSRCIKLSKENIINLRNFLNSLIESPDKEVHFTLKRGSSFSYIEKAGKFLEDEGAILSFTNNQNGIKCKFGYQTKGDKEFARTIILKIYEIIELRNYFNTVIEYSENKAHFILYNPLIDIKKIQNKFDLRKISNLKLSGYTYDFYRTNRFSHNSQYDRIIYEKEIQQEKDQRFIQLVEVKNKKQFIYAEIYETTLKNIIKIHNYFDEEVEYNLESMSLTYDNKEFKGFFHTIDSTDMTRVSLRSLDKERILSNAKVCGYPKEYLDFLTSKFTKSI